MTDEATPLAVDGGAPVRTRPYPAPPVLAPADDPAPVRALEEEFAALLGVPGSAVFAFGSHEGAWAAALAAAGVGAPSSDGPGEIVVPALLGAPLAAATRAAGAVPVPADVESDLATLSARGAVRALSDRTRAIGVAHAFGHPAAMIELTMVAEQRGLPIVEDASGAIGAAHRGRPAGTLGAAAVFALGAGHVLTAGAPALPERAALLVVPDPARADTAAIAATAAIDPLDEARAAIALGELRALPATLEARRQLAWELTFALRGMRGIVGMPHARWVRHGYDRYVLRLRGLLWKRSLDETIEALRAEGIPAEAACGPSLHHDAAVRAALPGDARLDDEHFPAATRLPDELIAIPLHANLTSKDMDEVAQALRRIERWST